MLKLRNISKYIKYGKNTKVILDNINLDFSNQEMTFILGPSGSGKTTLLNIIASNLKSDEGNIYVNGEKLNQNNQKELNYYRNNIVGYIYQDYNLIEYLNVYDNIMLGHNNSNYEDLNKLLNEFNLYDKLYTKVSKLSGGEKQRVAIIRTLLNNPQIILADEPTGALDYKNGIKIMEILKKISKDKTVIVVSHDEYLAKRYADRIINIKDGIIKNGLLQIKEEENYINVQKKNGKFNIFKIAFKNLMIHKGRTITTILANCLGFIAMLLVLSISSNFNRELELLEKDTVSVFPINIMNGKINNLQNNKKVKHKLDKIYIEKNSSHTNKIDEGFVDYLKSIKVNKNIVSFYDLGIPFITDSYREIDKNYLRPLPSNKYLEDNYNLIFGKSIENKDEILLKITSNNEMNEELLRSFGIDNSIEYGDIVGRKIRIIDNDSYYLKKENYYYPNYDYKDMYNNSNIELVIVGIIKEREDNLGGSFLYYDNNILDDVRELNKNSQIVLSQLNANTNVLGIDMDKNMMLNYLGESNIPNKLEIYVNNLKDKELILSKLDNFNQNNPDNEIIYQDIMSSNIKVVKDFINMITLLLIIFSIISIIISSLMIGILTSMRTLERKKEIGIIRSLGASRKEIRKLFNFENITISIVSSIIGLLVINAVKGNINEIIFKTIGLNNLLNINKYIFLGVLILNVLITKIASSIPSGRASRLEITDCIYNR